MLFTTCFLIIILGAFIILEGWSYFKRFNEKFMIISRHENSDAIQNMVNEMSDLQSLVKAKQKELDRKKK